jgi:hypothetical protein
VGGYAHALGGQEEQVGGGFAVGDFFGSDNDREQVADANGAQGLADGGGVATGSDADWKAGGGALAR